MAQKGKNKSAEYRTPEVKRLREKEFKPEGAATGRRAPSIDKRSGRDAVEAVLQVALALEADNLLGDFALVEHQQRRDRSNAVLRGKLLLLVDIDLGDLHPAIVFLRQLIENRRDHFAGTRSEEH